MPPRLVLPLSQSLWRRPAVKLPNGSTTASRWPRGDVTDTVSFWVNACSPATDKPPSVRPVTLNAPRIVVLSGRLVISSSGPRKGAPEGGAPMRRE